MKFETYGNCFVCGENNPNGLRLSFEIDKQRQTLKQRFSKPDFSRLGWHRPWRDYQHLIRRGDGETGLRNRLSGGHGSLEIKFQEARPDPRAIKRPWRNY